MIMAINMYLLHQIAIQIRYVGTRRPGPVDDRVTAFDNDSENENDDVSVQILFLFMFSSCTHLHVTFCYNNNS